MQRTLKLLGATGTVGLGLVASGITLATPTDGRSFDHQGMMGWGGWLEGPVMMLIFFIILVGVAVLVIRLLGANTSRSGLNSEDTAHSILREGFAKSEISKDEYTALRKVLDGEKT